MNMPCRRLSIIPTLVLSALCITPVAKGEDIAIYDAQSVGMSAERLARIKPHFDQLVADGGRSGFAVMIARDGKPVYQMATGKRDIEADLPMEMDTKFRIASMTKPITSVAAMILVEEGKLSLSDRVSKYIPEFANIQVATDTAMNDEGEIPTNPASRPMTVFQLLNHTSGLGYLFDSGSDLGKSILDGNLMYGPEDLSQFAERLAAQPLYFEPGEKWQYSFSVDILGRVIEVASSMKLEDFITTRIFKPLAMNDSRFILHEGFCSHREDNLAIIYRYDDNHKMLPTDADNCGLSKGDDHQDYPAGGAGIISTAGDYMRFLQMMANGGALNGTRILSTHTVARMTQNSLKSSTMEATPGMGGTGGGFGLGFAITLDASLAPVATSDREYSWGGYFGTTFWVAPGEDNLIAIMMSQRVPGPNDPLGYSDVRNQFRELVYGALED